LLLVVLPFPNERDGTGLLVQGVLGVREAVESGTVRVGVPVEEEGDRSGVAHGRRQE
jgi:hypothetical protein